MKNPEARHYVLLILVPIVYAFVQAILSLMVPAELALAMKLVALGINVSFPICFVWFVVEDVLYALGLNKVFTSV